MNKFGKNQWKIRLFNIITIVIVIGIVAVLALNAPKLLKKINNNRDSKKTESVDTVEKEKLKAEEKKEKEQKEQSQEQTMEIITETPVPEETKASLMTNEPDVSNLKKANVIAANASSTISQEGTSNSPMLLFDGREDTNWQEGVDGYGLYETISFSFDDFYKVKYIGFKLGNWKTDRYYVGNAKPKTMTLIFGDYVGQVTFTGERKVEWVEVNKAVNANSMNISIDDVYPGTQWEDTCITEIVVYGE